jgi:hypothetical protein
LFYVIDFKRLEIEGMLDIKIKLKLFFNNMGSYYLWLRNCIAAGFDIRDFFVFSGLFILSYGLFLYAPWVGYAVGGAILMLIGYLMKDKQ